MDAHHNKHSVFFVWPWLFDAEQNSALAEQLLNLFQVAYTITRLALRGSRRFRYRDVVTEALTIVSDTEMAAQRFQDHE